MAMSRAGHSLTNTTPPGRISRYLYPSSSPNGDGNHFYGRGDLLPQPGNIHVVQNPGLPMNVLQSINLTLSDIQMQLATISEQNTQRDSALKQLEIDIKEIKQSKVVTDTSTCMKKSRKSPKGLSACVRKIHSSFEEKDQFAGDERVSSPHNQSVIGNIVKNVISSGEFHTSKENVTYAAKKYHEYLVRQQKPVSDEQRKTLARANRIVQRRHRIYERRIKCCIGKEVEVMKQLSEKFMSDEESDSDDSLVKRPLTWRSENLNKLISKLDKRFSSAREKKDNAKPMKVRKIGAPSTRLPPSISPNWAVQIADSELTSTSGTPSSVSSDLERDSPDSMNEIYSDHELYSAEIGNDFDQDTFSSEFEDDAWMYEAAGIQVQAP